MNNINVSHNKRDSYIDFLRAFGLLLLFVAHTHPPLLLKTIRTFDVPLMVMVSALCYRPISKGYMYYVVKRFKRIYIPVFVFISIYFCLFLISNITIGKPKIDIIQIIGSYLMLNEPSIGYVWIMRVFLMIALIMPILYKITNKLNFTKQIVLIFSIIIIQHYLVQLVNQIENSILKFILDETVLYIVGYSSISLVGLKIKEWTNIQILIAILISSIILSLIIFEHGNFDPQLMKYPPQGEYILYGILCGCILWIVRPLMRRLSSKWMKGTVLYISKNSMWLYLWHIFPIILISPITKIPNLWFGRFCIVVTMTLLFYNIYSRLIKGLPKKLYELIK